MLFNIIIGLILLIVVVVTVLFIIFNNVPMPENKKKNIIQSSFMFCFALGMCSVLFYLFNY